MAASGEHIAAASDPAFQQYWINTALNAGIARADIDAFIAENGAEDLPTIISRLGPNPGPSRSMSPGPGTGTGSYSAAIQQSAEPYATPTPLGGAASITQPQASDARIVGAAQGGLLSLAAGAPVTNVAVLPAKGIPTWAIVLAALGLVLYFSDRK